MSRHVALLAAVASLAAPVGAQTLYADVLLTLNPSTGAPTVQNASLPTDKNRIAYRRGWNDLWLLGRGAGNTAELSSFVSDNTFGLAFDAVTTAYTTYVFADGFEVDGVCTWSDFLGGPSC